MAVRKITGTIELNGNASEQVAKLNEGMDASKARMQGIMDQGFATFLGVTLADAVQSAVGAMAAFGKESIFAAAELETQRVRVENLAGEHYPAITAEINKAVASSQGLHAEGDTSALVNNLQQYGGQALILGGQLGNIQKIAAITGESAEAMGQKLAMAITTGSSRALAAIPQLHKYVKEFQKFSALPPEMARVAREQFIINKMQAEGGSINTAFGKVVDTVNAKMGIWNQQIGNIKEIVGGLINTALSPLLSVGNKLVFWLANNERGMAVLKVSALALGAVMAGALTYGIALAGYTFIAAFWAPLLIIAAVIAAIALVVLVVDDLYTFFKGGQSIFGDFLAWGQSVWTGIWASIQEFWAMVEPWAILAGKILITALFPIAGIYLFWDELSAFVSKAVQWMLDKLAPIISVMKTAGSFLSGGGSSGSAESIPGRASGGPVSAGQLYRVNENGTEYFKPDVGGTVIPLGAGGAQAGGGGNVLNFNFNLNVDTSDLAGSVILMVKNALNELAETDLRAELGLAT